MGHTSKILFTVKSRMKQEIKEKGYSPRMVCLFSAGERLKTLACSPGSVLQYVSISIENFSTKGHVYLKARAIQLGVNPAQFGKQRKCFPKMCKISLKSKPAFTHFTSDILKMLTVQIKKIFFIKFLRQELALDLWLQWNSSGLVKAQPHSTKGFAPPELLHEFKGEKIPMLPHWLGSLTLQRH